MWQLILKTEDAKTYIDSVVSEVRDEIAHVYREKYTTLESTDKKTFDRLVEDDVIAFVKKELLGGKPVPIPRITQFVGER